MKTRYFYFMLAAALLAGCAKEMHDNQVELSGEKTVLEVGLAPQTRTHMDAVQIDGKHKVYWSNGDKVAANGVKSVALSGLPEYSQSAAFVFEGVVNSPYEILYPASAYVDPSHLTLPAIQDYRAGGFAEGMNPMAGYSTGGDITLSHLCAIVKISVKRAEVDADEDNLVSICFSGRNSEQVSGSFEIDYQAATLSGTSSAAEDKVVKVVKNQPTSTSSATVYYIVVPAGIYSNGFDVKVMDAKGHFMIKSKTTSKELEAGHIYAMKEFEFVPTGTELGIEIASAADLVSFAQNYNSGVYAGKADLIATLTANIDFSEGTAKDDFAATGGIGTQAGDFGTTADNFFLGIFNGNGKTISNFTANVPLFKYTRSATIIEDVTLDSTCSLTIDSPAAGANHAVLVAYNKGIVSNCASNASVIINNIQDVNTSIQNYGGLIAVNKGTVDGCTMAGDITCSQAGQTITANELRIGGIVAFQDDDEIGIINDCSFTGNIIISNGTTYGGITAESKYFYVAGILGRGEKAVITSCTAGIDGTTTTLDVRGIFVPAVGGIVGWIVQAADSEISECNNYMTLNYASNGARAKTTPCRIGGIAGRSVADINDCENSAAILSVCNSTTLYLGGIVADGANVNNCTNNAGGTITRSNADQTADQANRYMYIGGIMGGLNASSDIKDCTNHATVTSNPLGTATQTTIDMGGILGGGTQQVDISGCTNDAEIKLDNNNASAAAATRIAIGGVLGNLPTANTTVKECVNDGKVWCNNNTAGSYGPMYLGGTIGHTSASATVTDCTNSGEILCQNPGAAISAYVDLGGIVGCAEATISISGTTADATINNGTVTVSQASSAIVYARNTQGGILGYGKGNDTKIKNCKNTKEIKCDLSGVTANNRPSYTGGIVGLLANMSYTSNAASGLGSLSGLEIDHCNNTGKVTSSNYNNRSGNKNSAFAGGIVGLISGKSDSKASIHDCTVGTQNVYVYRGTGGGLIGYANLCTLADNTSSANMSGMNANVNGAGGIVGRLFDSSMTNCTFSGQIAKAKNIGGLVYTLSEQATGSTISSCKVNGATLTTGTATDATAAAVLVSITDSKTNSITGCGVKGTLNGAAISLSSNMITTDGGATVSGTYLIP